MVEPVQLHLFRGKRQRGRKAPAPLEFGLTCSLADLLRRWADQTWLWTHLPFGEKRSAATGARLKRMGVNGGWPDFVFLPPRDNPNPRPHFLELKREGMKIKPGSDQDSFRLWCLLHEHPHAVAHDLKEASEVLVKWGVLRNQIKIN